MPTLFLPGLEELAAADAPRLPALELLLARARAHPASESSCWAALARAAGGDLDRWPVGPVSALAELGAVTDDCLRVAPLGMDAEQQGVFRLRAAALAIDPEEADALAAAFNATFRSDGLRLVTPLPARWYLLRAAGGATAPWRGFPGPTLAGGARPAPPEPALRRLLSEVELLFFAHPVNEARRDEGRPLIAGLHPWGGGRLEAQPADGGPAGVAGEPYLAGLQRLGVAEPDDMIWPLAPEMLVLPALERLEAEVLEPLARGLRHGRPGRLRIVTDRCRYELATTDLWCFWRRPRHWATAC